MLNQFNEGDEIFMYTDGVTEAMDKDGKLYSEERLRETLNKNRNVSLENICKKVKEDIDNYSQDVEQSDDITMLSFKYFGNSNVYKNFASKENYQRANLWLQDNLNKLNASPELKQKIELSFEEIYTNIFSYAYPPIQGEVEISITKEQDDIILKFIDWGKPYDPLEKPDPNIDLGPDDRPVGGLGIFMVKQPSKDIEYRYDNANILTIKF